MKMNIAEKMWNTIVETNLASGHAHHHVEGENWGMLSIEDDYGVKAIWSFNKKTGEIKLKGA